jgi:hypothetical protein
MLDQLPEIMLAIAAGSVACGFINGLFGAFDQLDAVIVRWMCGVRFRG